MSAAKRPARVDAVRAQRRDRRRDDLDLLAAERAGLAGMRVEPGDREHRRGDAEIAPQRRSGDAAGMRRSPAVVERLDRPRSARWIVTGTTRSCGQTSIITGGQPAAGQLGEVFGVAGMAKPGAIERCPC